MAQLSTSEQITEQSKQIGMQTFCDLTQNIQECINDGKLRDYPPLFIASILGALAEVTLNLLPKTLLKPSVIANQVLKPFGMQFQYR